MNRIAFISIILVLTIAGNAFGQKKANLEGIVEGITAPDIILPDVNGDTIRLSDINDKIVLVNFWASWCAPCRKKAPVLVELYQEYKNADFNDGEKGFVVFSVSLDRNEIVWKSSIAKDSIGDFINVGDMMGWKSPAARSYNIKSIPSTVLLDGNGDIIAVNIRPHELKKKLKRLKKSGWLWF